MSATVDDVLRRADAWEESDHPRGEGGKFAESAAGKAITGYSTGALSVSERAPGKAAHGYSKVAHEATQRALGGDRQEHHSEAERAHRAAAEAHSESGREHANAAGNQNEHHGVASHLHRMAAAAHREWLEELWKKGEPRRGSDGPAEPTGTTSLAARQARRAAVEGAASETVEPTGTTSLAARRARRAVTEKAGKGDSAEGGTMAHARLDDIVADCDEFDRRHGGARVDAARSDEHIGWDNMVKKLRSEGHSKESAERIAGYINKKKYG